MPGRTDQDEASYRIAVCANTELLTQEPQKEKKPRSVVWTEYELGLASNIFQPMQRHFAM